jgi:hypothetical protein
MKCLKYLGKISRGIDPYGKKRAMKMFRFRTTVPVSR